MSSIALEGLTKTYPNGHCALQSLDLWIADGELLAVVGPSGCGKSTLLRLLAGLEDITAGTLRIGDRIANSLSPRERNVAMVFQDYALYPTMNVRGNLEFPLRMRRVAPAEIARRVAWAAELLDLTEVLHRLPRQLSGGQRQRVAMGRALVREPAVFLLDEPLSNLDARLRAEVRTEIADLQRRTGTTMIYVTHDQVEAMTLGQRIAVLHRGRLRQVADPGTLYAQPANPFVAGFIGTPPMNLFETHLEAGGEANGMALRLNGEVIAHLPELPVQVRSDRVIVGIRPESLQLTRPDTPGFDAVVADTEYLGHETLLHVRPGRPEGTAAATAPTLTVRLPGMHPHRPGERVRLAAPPDAIYCFEPDSEP